MKTRIGLLVLILILLLCGCKQIPDTYTVSVDGRALAVDTANHRVTCGDDTYTYLRTGIGYADMMTYYTTIYYPNGSKWEIEEEYVGNICVSSTEKTGEGFDGRGYLSGETLLEAVKLAAKQKAVLEQEKLHIDWAKLFSGGLLLILGALGLLFPQQMWNISVALKRWRYKDLDPSEEGMAFYKISSGILVVLGVIFILIAF